MEYGAPLGAAVKLPWDQMIHQEQQNYVMQQQKRLLAEQKAKLFADDADYNNVANSFDNPRIKEYALKKIGELGSFVKENPGWETDPNARIIYNQIKRDLKDNPELNRGLLSDANFQQYQKYIHDPKNADIINSPEFQKVHEQWQNYRQFGNQNGSKAAAENGIQPFMFTAPEDLTDTEKVIAEFGGKLSPTFIDSDSKYYRTEVTPQTIKSGASGLLMDPIYKRALEKDYNNKYKSQYGSVEDMVADRMKNYVVKPDVKPRDVLGDQLKRARIASYENAAKSEGANVLALAANASKELYEKGHGNAVPFKSDAITFITGSKNGLETSDVILPLALQNKKTQNIGKLNAVPKDKLMYAGKDFSGKDQWVAPFDVTVSADQMKQFFNISEDQLDDMNNGWDDASTNGKWSAYKNSIRREPVIDQTTLKQVFDESGDDKKPIYKYTFEVQKPIAINEWNSSAANAEYKVPTKQRSMDVDTEDDEDGKITIKGF